MGNPWDSNNPPPKNPFPEDDFQEDWDRPFAPPEKTNVTQHPSFHFEEQPIKHITGKFQAFRPEQPPDVPFGKGFEGETGGSNEPDPLESFLVGLPETTPPPPRKPLPDAPRQAPERIHSHKATHQGTLAVQARQPEIETNATALKPQPYMHQELETYPNTPPLRQPHQAEEPLLYDAMLTELSDLLQQSETNTSLIAADDLYLPFSQEDLLSVEERIIKTPPPPSQVEQIDPSLLETDSFGQGPITSYHQRSPMREDLGRPLSNPTGHMYIRRPGIDDNFAADWQSHDSLPALDPGQEAATGYLRDSRSLIDRFERVIVPGPEGEIPQVPGPMQPYAPYPPEAYPSGTYPPEAYPPGMYPPGMVPYYGYPHSPAPYPYPMQGPEIMAGYPPHAVHPSQVSQGSQPSYPAHLYAPSMYPPQIYPYPPMSGTQNQMVGPHSRGRLPLQMIRPSRLTWWDRLGRFLSRLFGG